jgi:hypothetical protein
VSTAGDENQAAEILQEAQVGTPATPRTPGESRGLRRPLSPHTLLAEATPFQRLREYLYFLELTTAADNLAAELERGVKENLSTAEVLAHLLEGRSRRPRLAGSRLESRQPTCPAARRCAISTSTFSLTSTATPWPSCPPFGSSRTGGT